MVVLDSSVLTVNLLRPTVQALGAAFVNEIAGKLGDRFVNTRSAVAVTGAATVVAAIAKNIFGNEMGYYFGLAAGVAGYFAHNYLFLEVPFNGVSDLKAGLFLYVVAVATKLALDNLPQKKEQPNNLQEQGKGANSTEESTPV